MVLDFYKLNEQPFGVTPDPRFLYLGLTHREALASLEYGVAASRGFTALIAHPGMGKTTLLVDLLNRVQGQAKTAFLFQSQRSPRALLRSLLEDLGIEDAGDNITHMQRKLNECLLSEASRGKQLVVVVDEAQNLNEPVLEVVRMLSNFETPREKLMHFILAGQPQLAEKLASPDLTQLRQRISIIARLKPFTAEETQVYIDHRLRVAGYDFKKPLFTKQALAMIAECADGIPRNINNVCFNAMSLGCVNKQKTIDTDVVREVLADLDLRPMFTEPVTVSNSEKPKELVPALPSRKTFPSSLRSWSIWLALAAALVVAADCCLLLGRPKQHAANVLASAPSQVAKESAPTVASSPVAPSLEHLSVPVPVASASPPSPESDFVFVQPHETLYRISLKIFGRYDEESLAALRQANPWLTNPRVLKPGQKIRIPSTSSTSRNGLPIGARVTTVSTGPEKP
jgi:type II secretory pathway predicted ATPase ExeA